MKNQILRPVAILGFALAVGSGAALANSMFIEGRFTEIDPAGQSYQDRGVCSFTTGPREDLAPGEFVLTVGDRHSPEMAELRLTGTYTAVPTDAANDQQFTLYPDKAAATQYIEGVLRKQLADQWAVFQLADLTTDIRLVGRERLLCSVSLTGRLTGAGGGSRAVSLSFSHHGQYFPGAGVPAGSADRVTVPGAATAPSAATAAAAAAGPSCPLAQLAPLGLAPVPGKCATGDCLVNFKNYRWWTSFQYYGNGDYFPGGGYFYNGGLQTTFAPRNVSVDSEGLHLKMSMQDLGGGLTASGAEAVLMFTGSSGTTEADLGYGDYLVAAKVKSAASWGALDPNAAFGAFTFERLGTGSTGPTINPHREIDLAEISRWGWNHSGTCPISPDKLCTGNAQFTLQPWDAENLKNLNRYTIANGVDTITLVMKWHGANQPVTFDQYNGAFTFADLPAEADYTWTTSSPNQDKYVPATNCERFHLNFWFGNYSAHQNPNPPPSTLPQEIVVTNFEFRPPR
jgi:hypothetical protein